MKLIYKLSYDGIISIKHNIYPLIDDYKTFDCMGTKIWVLKYGILYREKNINKN